jgi:hypothetical protein
VAACLQVRRFPVVLSRHTIANERRSDAVDDSRPPSDEYENGMKAPGSVMKAAGSVMKAPGSVMKAAGSVTKAAGSVMKVRMYLSASYINARVVANEALLLNVSRDRVRKRN